MTRWEYAEVWYTEGKGITTTVFGREGHAQSHASLDSWGVVLANLGAEGWEMVGLLGSPTGGQYWYYFKRPME